MTARSFSRRPKAVSANGPLLLWSTVTDLKYRMQQRFGGDRHYVWCSPCFDSKTLPKYGLSRRRAASADPAAIYRNYLEAIHSNDDDDAKILSQKTLLLGLAGDWLNQGLINEEQRADMAAIVGRATFTDWTPLIFVMPYAPLKARVEDVPRDRRASHEPEYIIADLRPGEFDIIEIPKP
jgi:hypothetical protein